VTDLPPLPADFDPEALVPEAFLERPPADAGDLTLDSVTVLREWLAYLREEGGVITIHMLDDDEIEQAVSALVDDYRRQGIDLWDRRDLLSTVWTTQTWGGGGGGARAAGGGRPARRTPRLLPCDRTACQRGDHPGAAHPRRVRRRGGPLTERLTYP
jgi:hypothetical protein